MSKKKVPSGVVVEAAGYRRGYTGRDHLLDDTPFAVLVGTVYPSERVAAAAAAALGAASAAPTYVSCRPVDDIPTDHVRAAVARAVRKGWGVVGDPSPPRTDARTGKLVVLCQYDYSPRGEAPAGCPEVAIRVYSV